MAEYDVKALEAKWAAHWAAVGDSETDWDSEREPVTS